MITVFTPAYNRGHLLHRVYESLCKQTFRDFEWVVVDDGSTDDSERVVDQWRDGTTERRNHGTTELRRDGETEPRNETRSYENENSTLYTLNSTLKTDSKLYTLHSKLKPFPIRYYYQENGGKHRAINRGVKEARGELFLILDSDDTLPEKSLETINHYYQQIKDDRSFGGVCGYMAHHDGTIIGRGCDMPVLDANSIDSEYKHHIHGDMCEVFRTSVLKEIPFPEIPGEKFVPEDLVLHRIAAKYQLRFFHEVIYYRDYLEGGLTDKIIKIRMTSPIASTSCYGELSERDIPIRYKIKAAINYYRFYYCLKDQKDCETRIRKKWFWTKPLGWLMHIHDLKVTK